LFLTYNPITLDFTAAQMGFVFSGYSFNGNRFPSPTMGGAKGGVLSLSKDEVL